MTTAKLLSTNVNEHVERKNGLSYLSWAWAWAEALKADPEATFFVNTFNDREEITRPFMDVNGTALVWVTVTMFGKQRTCCLPVMDHRNKAIPKPDAFQINASIMRCMTKCLALHGLGLYIYAGEDLPEEIKDVGESTNATQEEAQVESDPQDRDKAELFADAMINYVTICKDESGLKSYWKANQTKIDHLKANHPDLFEKIKSIFTDMKSKFQGEKNGEV